MRHRLIADAKMITERVSEGPIAARAMESCLGASLAFHRTEQDVVLENWLKNFSRTVLTGTCAPDSLAEHVPMAVFREGGETSQRRDVAGAFMASMDST